MFNANQAKAKSAENKTKNAVSDVEKAIKKAVEKGRTEVTFICAYDLIDDLTAILQTAGYKISPAQGGLKIYWG